jgi:hypothetical protein
MTPLPCYIYRDGTDFVLPSAMDIQLRRTIEAPEGLVSIIDDGTDSGRRVPDPQYFFPVSPDEAAVFLFPYELGSLLNLMPLEQCTAFLQNLPYFKGRERRHVFSDHGDKAAVIPLPIWLLKQSLLTSAGEQCPTSLFFYRHPEVDSPFCIPLPYMLPEHNLLDKPEFDRSQLKYDCSFVGGFSHAIRNVACAAVAREFELRFFNGGFDCIDIHENNFFTTKEFAPEENARRQLLFRQIIKESLMVLCPPGVGPQSYRFYETLYYGRIPILFTRKIRYPLEHLIDYEGFCFFIEDDELLETGVIIKRILHEYSLDNLWDRCILACKTWNKYFRGNAFYARLLPQLMAFLASLGVSSEP